MATGHRRIRNEDAVLTQLVQVLAGVADLAISGGAEGADTLFAQAADSLEIPVRVIYPNPVYRMWYPKSLDAAEVEHLHSVAFAQYRDSGDDWRGRWSREKWWLDNFIRNEAMIDEADRCVVISHKHPTELLNENRGGTASCVRSMRLSHPEMPVMWVKDRPGAIEPERVVWP